MTEILQNRNDYIVVILTYKRSENIHTIKSLRKHGYTGDYVLLLGNDDPTIDDYIKKYGEEKVKIFNKQEVFDRTDTMDSQRKMNIVVYARNAVNDIVKEMGYKYYIVLDDDYDDWRYRIPKAEYGGKTSARIWDLNSVFSNMVTYLANTPRLTNLCLSQGGDHFGSYDHNISIKRKAMNSFVCDVNRPFEFYGLINEDVNMYLREGYLGKIFFTIWNLQLDQKTTQKQKGGLTEIYLDQGTYVKSFYSVMIAPYCTKVRTMGSTNPRLHHSIDWKYAVPHIIPEKYKKK